MSDLLRDAAGGSVWMLAGLAWQSSALLALGLLAGVALARRPARAHRILLLAMIAAVVAPAAAHVVRVQGWGLWPSTAATAELTRWTAVAKDATAAAPAAWTTPAGPSAAQPIRPAMPRLAASPAAVSSEPERAATRPSISLPGLMGAAWGLLMPYCWPAWPRRRSRPAGSSPVPSRSRVTTGYGPLVQRRSG